MSEDPIEAIEQVMDCIKEGVAHGNESVIGGWLHNASKEYIIEWISGNIMGRLVNALERTKEALSATSEKWSEHDETYLKSALWHLCNSISNGKSQDFRSDLTEWMKGLKRRINAGEMKRNCDRFNTGDVEKDAQDALEAYLNSGVCGYRAIARWFLSPIERKSDGH